MGAFCDWGTCPQVCCAGLGLALGFGVPSIARKIWVKLEAGCGSGLFTGTVAMVEAGRCAIGAGGWGLVPGSMARKSSVKLPGGVGWVLAGVGGGLNDFGVAAGGGSVAEEPTAWKSWVKLPGECGSGAAAGA